MTRLSFFAVILMTQFVGDAIAGLGDVLLELKHPGVGDGASAAMTEDFVLVGSAIRSSVYVFDAQSGNRLADLKPATDIRGFGGALDIDGTTAIVGGHGLEAAYLFDVTSGKQLHKLVPSDPHPEQGFGSALAIDGRLALVGAYQDSSLRKFGGAAYVFDVETGQQLRKITRDVNASTKGLWPFLGGTLDLQGSRAVLGETNSTVFPDANGTTQGGAFVFDVETGKQLHIFRNPRNPGKPSLHDLFSSGIHIDDGQVIIGSSGNPCPDRPNTMSCGSAFVFDLETGRIVHDLTHEGAKSYEYFGKETKLAGNIALVSGMNDASNTYLFDLTSGDELLSFRGASVFATAGGKAALVRSNRTTVIDISFIPEPSSVVTLFWLAFTLLGWMRQR